MATFQYPDDNHRSGTARTGPGTDGFRFLDLGCTTWCIIIFDRQEVSGPHQLIHPVSIGHPAVMANAMEPSGQHMDEESPNELVRGQGHRFVAGTPLGPVVLPFEGDTPLIQREEPAIGDSDPVGIARQVGQHRFRAGKGTFGIDHPFLPPHGLDPLPKNSGISEVAVIAEELQFTTLVGFAECFEKQAPEQAGQHPHGQEEPGLAGLPALALASESSARDDAVHMGVVGEGRSPGVQNQGEADIRPQMFWITGNGLQGPGSRAEQDLIDHRLVLVSDVADRRRQGEDQVVVLHRQQVLLACLKPAPGRRRLALGAVPVAAGVVGNLQLPTTLTAQDMAAQFGTATALDGGHHLQLAQAQVSGLCFTPLSTVGTEDIRHLQRGGHDLDQAVGSIVR